MGTGAEYWRCGSPVGRPLIAGPVGDISSSSPVKYNLDPRPTAPPFRNINHADRVFSVTNFSNYRTLIDKIHVFWFVVEWQSIKM